MIKIENFNGKIIRSAVQTKKLSFGENIRTLTISDLHGYTSASEEQNQRLANAIKCEKPSIIFIAGDLFSSAKPWNGGEKLDQFKEFVRNISEVCPVCITWGNHDLINLPSKNKEEALNDRIKRFRKLESVRPGSVFPLYNDRVIINGMEVIGYVPRYELMAGFFSGLQTQIHGLAHDEFISDYNNEGVKFENRPGVINVYLGHDPHLIAASENGVGLGELSVCDFFITGHMHDGYKNTSIIKAFDKLKRTFTGKGLESLELDRGFTDRPTGIVDKNGKFILSSIRPYLGETNLCRGIVYLDDAAQQKFLQMPDGKFYKNASSLANVQDWKEVYEVVAREEILDDNLHFMLISEGLLFGKNEKLATINVVDIEGVEYSDKIRQRK